MLALLIGFLIVTGVLVWCGFWMCLGRALSNRYGVDEPMVTIFGVASPLIVYMMYMIGLAVLRK